MISTKYGFIFIHPEKTGGNSLTTVLESYCDNEVYHTESAGKARDFLPGRYVRDPIYGVHKHATAEDYYRMMGNDFFDYYIFCTARNPFDRAVSAAAFYHGRLSPPMKKTDFFIYEMGKPYNNILDYSSINGHVVADRFIRVEDFQSDFEDVCEDLGLPKIKVPKLNLSEREKDYMVYYTDKTRRYIEAFYKKDIDYFGYEF